MMTTDTSLMIPKMAVHAAFPSSSISVSQQDEASILGFSKCHTSFSKTLRAWKSLPPPLPAGGACIISSSSTSSSSTSPSNEFRHNCHSLSTLFNRAALEISNLCAELSSGALAETVSIHSPTTSSPSSPSPSSSPKAKRLLDASCLFLKQGTLFNVAFKLVVDMLHKVDYDEVCSNNRDGCCHSRQAIFRDENQNTSDHTNNCGCFIKLLFASLMKLGLSCTRSTFLLISCGIVAVDVHDDSAAANMASQHAQSRGGAVADVVMRHVGAVGFSARLAASALLQVFQSFLFQSCVSSMPSGRKEDEEEDENARSIRLQREVCAAYGRCDDDDQSDNNNHNTKNKNKNNTTCGTTHIFDAVESVMNDVLERWGGGGGRTSSSLDQQSSSSNHHHHHQHAHLNQDLHLVIDCMEFMASSSKHPSGRNDKHEDRHASGGAHFKHTAEQLVPLIASEGNVARTAVLVDFVSRARQVLQESFHVNKNPDDKADEAAVSCRMYSKREVDEILGDVRRQHYREEQLLRSVLRDAQNRNRELRQQLSLVLGTK